MVYLINRLLHSLNSFHTEQHVNFLDFVTFFDVEYPHSAVDFSAGVSWFANINFKLLSVV